LKKSSHGCGGKRRLEVPEGGEQILAALAELRSVQLTPEEKQILNEFESFQREHPIRFSSLTCPRSSPGGKGHRE
jgi:hypothetical protein